MTSAQVNAWRAAHGGVLDTVSRALDRTLEDVSLARMMLHRRRAIVAQVVGEFFAGLEDRFAPYLENRAPQAPKSVARELEISKAAGEMAESVCGSAPPLLFERALLAEMQGRGREAQSDLDGLLKLYPGFLAAAIASARLSLAADEPGRAIRTLAGVETELANTREGAAILADALRAVGMHRSASRYDLATLMCPGYADSRGNDCAPVDMSGAIARDARMPAAFIIGELPGGRLLCNDRGFYYTRHLIDGGLLLDLQRIGQRILGRCSSFLRARTKFLEGAIDRLNLAFAEQGWPFPGERAGAGGKAPADAASDDIQASRRPAYQAYKGLSAKLRRQVGKFAVAPFAVLARIATQSQIRGPVYRGYKRLPKPIRYRFNKHVLLPVRRLGADHWRQIPEQDWRSNIRQERLRIGVERILQTRLAPQTVTFEPIEMIAAYSGAGRNLHSDEFYDQRAVGQATVPTKHVLEPYGLPPAAEAIFRDLLRDLGRRESEMALADRTSDE